MPTQIKDEYEMIEEIGSGGMATVHKAMQKSLKRPVAIKELKKAYRADEQIVKRFERESMVAASLQHENIVHIYDYWKKPHYCIVMEYVDGANLADVIAKAGALPVDVAVMIAIQVCSALEYAHMRGLIHRDIKPSNIMIKRNGEVKLMDFGIAHTRDLEALTLPGTMIGTPAYMSPEQILGQNLDVRSDIFSFGIVLYELFTGMKPFMDDDTRAVSARIVNDAFHPAAQDQQPHTAKRAAGHQEMPQEETGQTVRVHAGNRAETGEAARGQDHEGRFAAQDLGVSRFPERDRTASRAGNPGHYRETIPAQPVQANGCRGLDRFSLLPERPRTTTSPGPLFPLLIKRFRRQSRCPRRPHPSLSPGPSQQ